MERNLLCILTWLVGHDGRELSENAKRDGSDGKKLSKSIFMIMNVEMSRKARKNRMKLRSFGEVPSRLGELLRPGIVSLHGWFATVV